MSYKAKILFYGKDYKKMRRKFQYALLSTLAAFIIMPTANVNATEKAATGSSIAIVEDNTRIQADNTSDTVADLPGLTADNNDEFDFTPAGVVNKTAKRSDFINKTSDTILVGDTGYITLSNVPSDYTVSFKSSDKSKLSIKEISQVTCKYTGKAAGTEYITVKIKEPGLFFLAETVTFKYKVTISPRAVSIKFNKSNYKVAEGNSIKPKLTIRPSISKEAPEFDTTNPRIATVNSKGKVYGKNNGTTYLTATISNGKSAKCKISVTKD